MHAPSFRARGFEGSALGGHSHKDDSPENNPNPDDPPCEADHGHPANNSKQCDDDNGGSGGGGNGAECSGEGDPIALTVGDESSEEDGTESSADVVDANVGGESEHASDCDVVDADVGSESHAGADDDNVDVDVGSNSTAGSDDDNIDVNLGSESESGSDDDDLNITLPPEEGEE